MRTARVIPWHVNIWGKEWLWKETCNKKGPLQKSKELNSTNANLKM